MLNAVVGAQPTFTNHGVLEGFTGANQISKVTETRELDHDGNGTSLRCLMLRDAPDTPSGGCHAEAHLNRFPSGEPIGKQPGFEASTTYWVRFDPACNAASVAFFQYKNFKGPKQWDHLVALWRKPGSNGTEIMFQVNFTGENRLVHARLSNADGTALAPDRWHEIRVVGNFTKEPSGWAEVFINGKTVEWYRDPAFKNLIGKKIVGQNLPDLPGAEWQLQLGGYGYFKDKDTRQAVVHVDDIRVTRP